MMPLYKDDAVHRAPLLAHPGNFQSMAILFYVDDNFPGRFATLCRTVLTRTRLQQRVHAMSKRGRCDCPTGNDPCLAAPGATLRAERDVVGADENVGKSPSDEERRIKRTPTISFNAL